MYIPVVVLFIVILGLAALDSRADELNSRTWLRLEALALKHSDPFPSVSAKPHQARTLHYQAPLNRAVANADNVKILKSHRILSEPQAADTNERLVQRAQELIGTPYQWGGMSEAQGFDCSGLLVYLFRSEAGTELPRTTNSMMLHNAFQRVPRHELQPGDAVFFTRNGPGRVDHVGLYIGGNQFIHAPRTGKTIRIDSLDNRYWHDRYASARRFENELKTRS